MLCAIKLGLAKTVDSTSAENVTCRRDVFSIVAKCLMVILFRFVYKVVVMVTGLNTLVGILPAKFVLEGKSLDNPVALTLVIVEVSLFPLDF